MKSFDGLNICELCGYPRNSRRYKHTRCSRILQQRNARKNQSRAEERADIEAESGRGMRGAEEIEERESGRE